MASGWGGWKREVKPVAPKPVPVPMPPLLPPVGVLRPVPNWFVG